MGKSEIWARECMCPNKTNPKYKEENDYLECDAHPLKSGKSIFDSYEAAMKWRLTKKTLFNDVSSRGHVVIQLKVSKGQTMKNCEYSIVDLAGYETPFAASQVDKASPSEKQVLEAEGTAIKAGITEVGDAMEIWQQETDPLKKIKLDFS